MEWYYADAGQRAGPIDESELQTLYASGKVQRDTLVWKAGMPDWQPLESMQLPWMGAPPSGTQFCTECGKPFDPADLIPFSGARVCAACKDVFFQRLREQGTAALPVGVRRYGGFWIRFLARVIDGLILSVVFILLVLAWTIVARRTLIIPGENPAPAALAVVWGSLALLYLISSAFFVTYEAWFLSQRGATPGKLALGLRVIRSDGNNLTAGRSIGRSCAYLLNSLIPFAIGFILAGFDAEKRALHDHLCDTRVVYKSA